MLLLHLPNLLLVLSLHSIGGFGLFRDSFQGRFLHLLDLLGGKSLVILEFLDNCGIFLTDLVQLFGVFFRLKGCLLLSLLRFFSLLDCFRLGFGIFCLLLGSCFGGGSLGSG